jgi:hypothetical protein
MTVNQHNERDVNGRGQRNTKSCLEMEYETLERQERCRVQKMSPYPWRACAGGLYILKSIIHRTGNQILQCNTAEEGWLCMSVCVCIYISQFSVQCSAVQYSTEKSREASIVCKQ